MTGKEQRLKFFNNNDTNLYKMQDNVSTENNNHNKHPESTCNPVVVEKEYVLD